MGSKYRHINIMEIEVCCGSIVYTFNICTDKCCIYKKKSSELLVCFHASYRTIRCLLAQYGLLIVAVRAREIEKRLSSGPFSCSWQLEWGIRATVRFSRLIGMALTEKLPNVHETSWLYREEIRSHHNLF